ncbi:MAG: PAS domain S-box protein [Nitrospirae bacterium YQR-1]
MDVLNNEAELVEKLQNANNELKKEIAERKRVEEEISALLCGSRAVLQYKEFADAARAIFDACKEITGATAGYVALLTKDGSENEVLFLDAGGMPCTVDPSLPMPIRGLREVAYRNSQVVYDNNFKNSSWKNYMPKGHMRLDNVMFSPLIIDGKAVGVIGLANKKGGFNDRDARLALAFGEYAAISLLNSRNLDLLESSELRLRSIVETANDAIVSIDENEHIIYWNKAAEKIFGFSAAEVLNRPIIVIIPERFHKRHHEGLRRFKLTGTSNLVGRTFEMVGLKSNGEEFPIEISLAMWKIKEDVFFTGTLRDITEVENSRRKDQLMYEQSRHIAMGELLVNIAHQWRQPLSAIAALVQDIRDTHLHGEFTAEYLEKNISTIVSEVMGLSSTIDNFRNYYIKKPQQMQFNIAEVINNTLSLIVGNPALKNVIIEKELDDVLTVNLYKGEFAQVILNILTNIKDVFEDRHVINGIIRIRAYKDTAIDKIVITIADNGGGVDKGIIGKIFDPYFTTKDKSRGTGLGLYISKVIIEKSINGAISVKSVDGWCEFRIEL